MIKKLTGDLDGYDLCIIGSGPAGMTVAAELAYSGLKICVLESGVDKRSDFADKLKEALSDKMQIKENSRERVVGGASSTWNGLSAPFDAIDFEPRDWTAGWPVSYKDLVPYLARASAYRFPAPKEFVPHGHTPLFNGLQEKAFVMPIPTYRFSFLRTLFEREGLDLFLDASVVNIVAKDGSVSEVVCKQESGAEFRVRAKKFVLAAGGIENARILLNSNLGNEHDQVGRYFMNHPKSYQGYIKLSRLLPPRSLYLPQTDGPRMQYVGLRLPEDYQRKRGLLNSYVGFEPSLGRLERYAFAIWKRMPVFSTFLMRTLARPRKLRCRWFADMEPRAENRITLSGKVDALGMPLPLVSYELGPRDKDTLRALWSELKRIVEAQGIGRLSGDMEKMIGDITFDSSHHMGATRMGADPQSSVVDADCRVHSQSNLYVAGSSVFATAGCANPTMVVVALSIRLADHLRGSAAPEPLPQKTGKSIAIIGGGRRVREDVVPALEHLEPLYSVEGIYTRGQSSVFGRKRRYDTKPLASFDAQGVAYIYIAVPPRELLRVLKSLPKESYSAELIIDTPAPTSGTSRRMLEKFKKVHVAEDSAYLPWLDNARVQKPREIFCDRSVFRYHGVALLKALCGTQDAPASVRWGLKKGSVITLQVGSAKARIIDARDYAKGKLIIDGKEPAIPTLGAEESALMGDIAFGDTIVTRMLELKRVGLARMLKDIASGKEPWPLTEGINDARVDSIVHRFGVYFSL